MSDIVARRRSYADEVLRRAGSESAALREAFAAVPRERFLGPGPWTLIRPPDGVQTVEDPAELYECALVAIDGERNLNNGEPVSLARWIASLDVRPGEHVVHVGAGVGYYTAILAELVGPEGSVVGFEVDAGLARRAAEHFADRPNVRIVHGEAAEVPPADAIFVSAGCTHPRASWLEAIRPGGRLLVPLTGDPPDALGAYWLLTRGADAAWAARAVSLVLIYPCSGARDPEEAAAIAALVAQGREATKRGRSMRLDAHDPDATCLIHTGRYCISQRSTT